MQGTGSKFGINYGERPSDIGTDTRDSYRNMDFDSNQGNGNSQYRGVFKPNTLSKERLQTKDIDNMTKNLTDELDIIQSHLNKKSHLLSQPTNDAFSKPNMGGPSTKFGGIPRSENKSNGFSNGIQDLASDNFPSRISKNTLSQISPSNGGALNKPLFKSGVSNNNQGITLPSYQDSDFNSQPYSTTNKGNTVGGGLKNNQFGENTLNKFEDKDDGPTDTRTSKVFSKPNLKRVPNKQKEEAINEDHNAPKNTKPNMKPNMGTKNAPVKKGGSTISNNPQPKVNQLEEIPIAQLKGGGDQLPDEDMDAELILCPEGCGRKFKAEALEKHAKACKKVFQSQRKKFDSAAARKTEEQLKLEVKPRRNQAQSKQPQKRQSTSAEPKWKYESEALRDTLKAVRGEI